MKPSGGYHNRLVAGMDPHSAQNDVGGTFSGEMTTHVDRDLEKFYEQSTDERIREIMQEIEEERLAGKLRPFVEGEPIGALPRRMRHRPLFPVEVQKRHNERMERRRKEMLDHRRENDQKMEES